MKEYSITEEKCKSLIRGVCNGCGGVLSPIETVDNAGNPTFWPHCPSCQKYHYGTPLNVFVAAKKLFEGGHIPYDFIKEGDYQYKESQISGACALVEKVMLILESKT